MKNLKDEKTKTYPSTTRGGKELPSSSALDSPSVMSKLATPTPASAIRSDMSHVIDDATSAMHDTYDETASMPDTTVPLSEFLDEQIARVIQHDVVESDDELETETPKHLLELALLDMNCLLCLRVMLWMKKLLETFLLAMTGATLRNY